jgi:hypothetical protein
MCRVEAAFDHLSWLNRIAVSVPVGADEILHR